MISTIAITTTKLLKNSKSQSLKEVPIQITLMMVDVEMNPSHTTSPLMMPVPMPGPLVNEEVAAN